MNLTEQELSFNTVFLGDGISQYLVLQWIMGEAFSDNMRENPVGVYYGPQLSIKEWNGIYWAASERVLPGVNILVPRNMEDIIQPKINVSTVSRYLIFEADTYGKDSTYHMLKQISENCQSQSEAAALVVLLDLNRRQGSTDLSLPGEDIETAQREFSRRDVPVKVVHEDSGPEGYYPKGPSLNPYDMMKIQNWYEPWDDMWLRRIEKNFNTLAERIKLLEDDYRLGLELIDLTSEAGGILGPISMEHICSFETVKKFKKPKIWDNYTSALEKRLFPLNNGEGLNVAAEIYEEILKEMGISAWDTSSDRKKFINLVHFDFYDFMSKKNQSKKDFFPQTEENYRLFTLADTKSPDWQININFPKAAAEFVNIRVLQLLKQRLENRKQQLGRALSVYSQQKGILTKL